MQLQVWLGLVPWRAVWPGAGLEVVVGVGPPAIQNGLIEDPAGVALARDVGKLVSANPTERSEGRRGDPAGDGLVAVIKHGGKGLLKQACPNLTRGGRLHIGALTPANALDVRQTVVEPQGLVLALEEVEERDLVLPIVSRRPLLEQAQEGVWVLRHGRKGGQEPAIAEAALKNVRSVDAPEEGDLLVVEEALPPARPPEACHVGVRLRQAAAGVEPILILAARLPFLRV
mmetsp:Transcript_101666/g.303370  ORF Transcript_101666/g.303370 Transcript_101666/m.303370 type:complete len:230 (+) Transcript_101666:604-1293(+)